MLCSDLGETLTSISHGLRDSSSNTSKPNNSWQQYRRRTFPTIMLFMLPSALQRTSYTVSSRANKVSVNKVIERQTDRQTVRETDRETERQTQTDRQTDTERQTDTDRLITYTISCSGCKRASSRANKVSVNKVIISAEDVRTWEQFWWQGQWSCSRLSWYRCPACPGVPTAFSATWPATQISTHTYVTADILLLILLIGHAVLSRNDLKMNLSVTHVMCNCSSKFEHCMVFCFWVNGRHKTDGLMKA